MLTGQVPDRQPAPRRVSGVPHEDLAQPAQALVFDQGRDLVEQDGVTRGLEEVPDVEGQKVRRPARARLGVADRSVVAAACAACVAVGVRHGLEGRLQRAAQRVVHDTIAKRGRADHPGLRVSDAESAERPGGVGSGEQRALQLKTLGLQVEKKACGVP